MPKKQTTFTDEEMADLKKMIAEAPMPMLKQLLDVLFPQIYGVEDINGLVARLGQVVVDTEAGAFHQSITALEARRKETSPGGVVASMANYGGVPYAFLRLEDFTHLEKHYCVPWAHVEGHTCAYTQFLEFKQNQEKSDG